MKNPAAPALKRKAEEDWGRSHFYLGVLGEQVPPYDGLAQGVEAEAGLALLVSVLTRSYATNLPKCGACFFGCSLADVSKPGGPKMLNKTKQSDGDRTPNENGKPENCYCSALPKGSVCLPFYTQWLRDRASPPDKLSALKTEAIGNVAACLIWRDVSERVARLIIR